MTDHLAAARGACLMLGMAQKLGVDPHAMVAAGRLEAEDLAEMVDRCRGCARRDDCILWMVERATAGAPPGYCPNGERLSVLRG